MSDGNSVAIEVEPANYEPPGPSALEQEIQALLDALTLVVGTSPTQQQEVGAAFLCLARSIARRAADLPAGQRRSATEELARRKMAAAKNVLGGGK